jgi:hypothetical protein
MSLGKEEYKNHLIKKRKEKINTSFGKEDDHTLLFPHYFMETKCFQGVVDDDFKRVP